MEGIQCKIFPTLSNNRFIFPEQDIVNPNKLAIALSGGGSRSYAICIGIFRALLRKDEHFLRELSYISAVSGASWFLSVLMFAKQHSLHELLGVSIHRITQHRIHSENFNNPCFMGHCILHFPIMDYLSEALQKGIPHSKCFRYILSKVFLERYYISRKIPVMTEEDVERNRKENRLSCITPREESPFLLFQAALVDTEIMKDGLSPFEYTQMYSGQRVPYPTHGGLYFENPGLGACKSNVRLNEINEVTVNNCSANIESIIAASSAAFTTVVLEHPSSIVAGIVESMSPILNVYGEESGNARIDLTDGAFCDNSGIIGCLARNCRKILSIVSSEGIKDEPSNMSVAHLFGISEHSIGSKYRKNLKVFHSSDWKDFYETVQEKVRNKDVVYVRKNLEVLQNWQAGINGGYTVELLVVFVERASKFDQFFDQNFKESDRRRILKNFPNYPVFYASKTGNLLSLSKSEINILSTYSDWMLTEIMDKEQDFFQDIL